MSLTATAIALTMTALPMTTTPKAIGVTAYAEAKDVQAFIASHDIKVLAVTFTESYEPWRHAEFERWKIRVEEEDRERSREIKKWLKKNPEKKDFEWPGHNIISVPSGKNFFPAYVLFYEVNP